MVLYGKLESFKYLTNPIYSYITYFQNEINSWCELVWKLSIKSKPQEEVLGGLIVFIGNILGIYLIGFLGLGIKLSSFDDILLLVLFIGLLNAILWPILTRIAMPFLVLTFGFGTLILNGFLLEEFAPLFGIEIQGPAIILAPLGMAAVTTILSSLITIDDDSSYYRSVLNDAKKKRKAEVKEYPGVIIVEIDGLAYEVL